MRRNILTHTLILLLVMQIFSSCLPLVKSEPFDTNGNWLSEYTMVQWLASTENREYTLFYQAACHCGLTDEINSSTDKTYIVPSDAAFTSLLSSLGIDKVTDIPASVLYDFMKYLVIPIKVRSTELEPEMANPYITESGKPIYISRRNSGANPYLLQINTLLPIGNTTFGGTKATVTMQDATFSDNMAHMVDAVPFYAPKVSATETFTGKLESDNIKRIDVNIDTYIYRHEGFINVQSSKKILANTVRIPVIWYENPELPFADEIRSAKVYFYLTAMTGLITCDFTLHDISSQLWTLTNQGSATENLLNAVYGTFDPQMNLDNAITNIAIGSVGAWFSADITDFVKSRYSEQERLPIGISMYPVTSFTVDNGLELGYKQDSNGANHNQSYIEVMGKVLTKSILSKNEELICDAGAFVEVKDDKLLREKGPSAGSLRLTPNNILYSIKQQPKFGSLTRNGLPLGEGVVFTQAEINAGSIRYYNTITSSNDSFILTGSDYTGSVMENDFTVNVAIR